MCKKMKLNPYLTKLHSQKLIQNGLEMNIIPETIKLLEESMANKILDIGLAMIWGDLTPKQKQNKCKTKQMEQHQI